MKALTPEQSDMVEANRPLIYWTLARRYVPSWVDRDDLVGDLHLCLVRVIAAYRPELGRVSTYAVKSLHNAITGHLRARYRVLKQTKSINQFTISTDACGHNPLGVEEPPHCGDGVDLVMRFRSLVAGLNYTRRMVIRHAANGHTQAYSSERLGFTKQRVSQLVIAALKRLRHKANLPVAAPAPPPPPPPPEPEKKPWKRMTPEEIKAKAREYYLAKCRAKRQKEQARALRLKIRRRRRDDRLTG